MSEPSRDRQLVLAEKLRAGRGPLTRLAEVRGWVGGHRAPHRTVALRTTDGIRLAATWLPGPASTAPAVVLVHGFAAHRRKPAYAFLADHLAATANVLAVDLRGHGGSDGVCALGATEWRDLEAAVSAVRGRTRGPVIVVGLSMGGTATCHALSRGLDADAAVLISSSARHWDRTLPGMATLEDLLRSGTRRRIWQALARFRVSPPAHIEPYEDPVQLIAGVEVPTLIIHGADDGYFSPDHARDLHAAAGGRATLWEEPAGFGHAEDGLTPAFVGRLAGAISTFAAEGRFPARQAGSGGGGALSSSDGASRDS